MRNTFKRMIKMQFLSCFGLRVQVAGRVYCGHLSVADVRLTEHLTRWICLHGWLTAPAILKCHHIWASGLFKIVHCREMRSQRQGRAQIWCALSCRVIQKWGEGDAATPARGQHTTTQPTNQTKKYIVYSYCSRSVIICRSLQYIYSYKDDKMFLILF